MARYTQAGNTTTAAPAKTQMSCKGRVIMLVTRKTWNIAHYTKQEFAETSRQALLSAAMLSRSLLCSWQLHAQLQCDSSNHMCFDLNAQLCLCT